MGGNKLEYDVCYADDNRFQWILFRNLGRNFGSFVEPKDGLNGLLDLIRLSYYRLDLEWNVVHMGTRIIRALSSEMRRQLLDETPPIDYWLELGTKRRHFWALVSEGRRNKENVEGKSISFPKRKRISCARIFSKKKVPVYFYLVILKIGTTPRQGSNESTGKWRHLEPISVRKMGAILCDCRTIKQNQPKKKVIPLDTQSESLVGNNADNTVAFRVISDTESIMLTAIQQSSVTKAKMTQEG